MRITLDIPDTVSCAFFNYVFTTEEAWSMSMGCRSIGTNELNDGAEIKVTPYSDDVMKGGNE